MEKMPSALHLPIVWLVLQLRFFDAAKNTTSGGCISHERKALLNFRASFIDPSNRLSSWENHTDCCTWEAVRCNHISGHVIKLDLGDCMDLGDGWNVPFDIPTTALQTLLEFFQKALAAGIYSTWISPKTAYMVLKGAEMDYTTTLEYLGNLDLSCNNLVGGIPSELIALDGLEGLNLSYNHLHGEIPRMIGRMNKLESLDLSNNNLFGRIPESLSDNIFLTKLNLSNNNLSGQIPTGRQLQTLEDGPSIYGGNPLLCGAPLPKKCPGKETQKPMSAENDEDTVDRIWLYSFVMGGYATGLWGFIGVVVVKRRWRYAFGYIEAAYRKMVGR